MSLDLDGPVLTSFRLGSWEAGRGAGTDTEMSLMGNLSYIAGYIPVIGIIAGLFHIVVGRSLQTEEEAESRAFGRVWVVRGILEILGVGILLAPIDIGCTIARFVRDFLDEPSEPSALNVEGLRRDPLRPSFGLKIEGQEGVRGGLLRPW
jgi:hypothetical protein